MTARGTSLNVVLHPWFPPEIDTALRSVPGLALHTAADQDDVAQAMENGGEVLVTSYWRGDYLTPSLRWIAGTGAGTEQYPLELFAERGVALTTARGVHAVCVAEHVFALLLSLTRRISPAVRDMVEHRWTPRTGEELNGKRLLVVGLGLIGEEVARRAQAWGMDVRGIKRNVAAYMGCVEEVHTPDRLQALCEWADIVVLCAPSSPDTRRLIGAEELALLGAGWLVNVGRGDLVDPEALAAALTRGELRGAGLDVTSPEPLPPGSPLWNLPNLTVTAHMAGNSPGFGPRWLRLFERNLAAYQDSGTWVNRVHAGATR